MHVQAAAPQRVAIVGGGWAGIAAAVRLVDAGAQVQLFEAAAQLGGRARSLDDSPETLDNGQHIMIGAYARSLALMAQVGAPVETGLLRLRLRWQRADGSALCLGPGPTGLAFALAVLRHRSWRWPERLSLLQHCLRWAALRFRLDEDCSVEQLCHGMAQRPYMELIAPLCISALNTPAAQASAQVFLRVLHDSLFGGRGAADLLLPRRPLGALLASPADRWLRQRGASLHLRHAVQCIDKLPQAWSIEGQTFDQVILACSASGAARLAQAHAPAWAAQAQALKHQPIVTVYLESPDSRWPAVMLALDDGPTAPAQFGFDLGQLGLAPGRFALVISGAQRWLDEGLDALAALALEQARRQLPWRTAPKLLQVIAEKRATFACTPGLQRPGCRVAEGLWAAGDYVEGPYPATLEGAVRSAEQVVAALIGR